MTPVGFETTVSAGKRSQTYALDRAATGTGIYTFKGENISVTARLGVLHTSPEGSVMSYDKLKTGSRAKWIKDLMRTFHQ